MQALLIVINILLILNAIIIIISVLMQDGARSGLGAIGGGAETFFGKSKARTYEKKLEMITKVGVASFIVLAILMTAINARQGISNLNPVDLSTAPSVSELLDQKKTIQGEGLDTSLPEATIAPEETVAPEAEAPAVIEPTATEAPAVVEPTATEAPAVIEPTATEAPAVVEPTATKAPAVVEPTATETPAA